jgi:hypothetical protein
VLLAYYLPFANHPGISIRLHSTTLYNSIFWFDDDMLVNTHVYGVPAHFAPTLHLRHLSSGTLFQTYARSFDRVAARQHLAQAPALGRAQRVPDGWSRPARAGAAPPTGASPAVRP